ncbi:major facilitator superfamily domain-containing protein [Cladochytrium replicatum]|nr:major facilitator superfamily domain-containing protein [Cladochytrium replicatum]
MADHAHDDTDTSTHHGYGSDTHSINLLSELEHPLPAEPTPANDDHPPLPLSPFQFMLAFGSLCVRPDLMGWVGTSYMLTSTALAPVLGKVAGSVGGRAAMITSVALYSAGALISATTPSMEIVIIGRAISGMGGAGMFTIALITVANIVPFRKRAMYQGCLSALLGVGLVIGPLLGGAFTDWLGWPAIFYWNAFFGAFTLVCLFFVRMDLPRQPHQPTDGVTESRTSQILKKMGDIDWAGLVVLILALVCLLTPLQMGGTASNPWVSPQILIPLLASLVLAGLFVYVEGWVFSPNNAMVPPAVFSTRTVIAAEAMSFCMGASMLCLTYFMPTFWQVVGDRSAMLSGLDTIPILGGMIATSLFSGWVITRYQKYQPFLRFGSPLLIVRIQFLWT